MEEWYQKLQTRLVCYFEGVSWFANAGCVMDLRTTHSRRGAFARELGMVWRLSYGYYGERDERRQWDLCPVKTLNMSKY